MIGFRPDHRLRLDDFHAIGEQAVPPLYYCKKQNDKYAVFIRFEATHVSILAANYMDLLLVATTAAAPGRLLDATHNPKQNYSL